MLLVNTHVRVGRIKKVQMIASPLVQNALKPLENQPGAPQDHRFLAAIGGACGNGTGRGFPGRKPPVGWFTRVIPFHLLLACWKKLWNICPLVIKKPLNTKGT